MPSTAASKTQSVIAQLSLCAVAALGLAACDPSLPPQQAPKEGRYWGSLNRSSVLAQGKPDGRAGFLWSLEGGPELRVRLKRKKILEVSFPVLGDQALELKRDEEGCFSRETREPATRLVLCHDATWLDLRMEAQEGAGRNSTGGLASFTLTLSLDDPAALPPLEEPRVHSRDELLRRALESSFESRAEFERLVQARLDAKAAYLQLLPRVNLNTALGFVNFQWLSLVRMASDLAPFLFPTRWFKADAARHAARAERYAMGLVRADSAFSAHSLALSAQRDELVLKNLREQRQGVSGIRDELAARERLGLLPPGASDDLTSLLNGLEGAELALRDGLATQLGHLSRAAGYRNPGAVTGVLPETAPDTGREGAPESSTSDWLAREGLLTPQHVATAALTRSLELRQNRELQEEARSRKRGRFLQWIDPGGESAGAIGFGLPSYIQVASSQIRSLEIAREAVESRILGMAAERLRDFSGARERLAIAVRDREVQARRLDRLVGALRLGVEISQSELLTAVQGRVRNEVELAGLRAELAGAEAALDRLLYFSDYASVRDP